MLKLFILIWVVGLFSIVPYGIYYLLFEAPPEEYAFWIVFPLFWVFGYWGVVGPILSAIKTRQFFNAIEKAQSSEELKRLIDSDESQDVIIETIASENHIPKFLAKKILKEAIKRYSVKEQ